MHKCRTPRPALPSLLWLLIQEMQHSVAPTSALHAPFLLAKVIGCNVYFFSLPSFSITGHQVVKVARLTKLVHSYLTR